MTGGKFEYEGEVDENNQPCGYGVKTYRHLRGKEQGMYLNGMRHGLSNKFFILNTPFTGMYSYEDETADV